MIREGLDEPEEWEETAICSFTQNPQPKLVEKQLKKRGRVRSVRSIRFMTFYDSHIIFHKAPGTDSWHTLHEKDFNTVDLATMQVRSEKKDVLRLTFQEKLFSRYFHTARYDVYLLYDRSVVVVDKTTTPHSQSTLPVKAFNDDHFRGKDRSALLAYGKEYLFVDQLGVVLMDLKGTVFEFRHPNFLQAHYSFVPGRGSALLAVTPRSVYAATTANKCIVTKYSRTQNRVCSKYSFEREGNDLQAVCGNGGYVLIALTCVDKNKWNQKKQKLKLLRSSLQHLCTVMSTVEQISKPSELPQYRLSQDGVTHFRDANINRADLALLNRADRIDRLQREWLQLSEEEREGFRLHSYRQVFGIKPDYTEETLEYERQLLGHQSGDIEAVKAVPRSKFFLVCFTNSLVQVWGVANNKLVLTDQMTGLKESNLTKLQRVVFIAPRSFAVFGYNYNIKKYELNL